MNLFDLPNDLLILILTDNNLFNKEGSLAIINLGICCKKTKFKFDNIFDNIDNYIVNDINNYINNELYYNIDKYIHYILKKNKILPPTSTQLDKLKLDNKLLNKSICFSWLLQITDKEIICHCTINEPIEKVICCDCKQLLCTKCNDLNYCDVCHDDYFCYNCINICEICDKKECKSHEDNYVNCAYCGILLCDDCINVFCDECGDYACENCTENYDECTNCDYIVCSDCTNDRLTVCNICDDTICLKYCSNLCADCNIYYCNNCEHICN